MERASTAKVQDAGSTGGRRVAVPQPGFHPSSRTSGLLQPISSLTAHTAHPSAPVPASPSPGLWEDQAFLLIFLG